MESSLQAAPQRYKQAKAWTPTNMSRPATLTEGPIASTLLRLAAPIIGANMLQVGYQITDTFWVGRLSTQAVAAVAICFPINFLMIAIGGGLPIAGTVLIAQYKGRGDREAMGHVAAQTLVMVLGVAIILSVTGYLLAEPIVRLMGAEAEVIPDAVRFLQITFLGFFFVFGFFVYQSLMRGIGIAYPPMFIVLVTVLLNFALDPLFIFGYGPIPPMGVAGAAMATVCTQALATAIGFGLLLGGRHDIRIRWSNFRLDLPLIARSFQLGLPTSVEQSSRAMGMTMMTVLASHFGTVTVAAYGTGTRVLACVIIPALGLSMAVSALVAQNIGAGRIDRAERTSQIGAALAFTALLIPGLALFIFARPLVSSFIPGAGEEAINQCVAFIRTMAFTFGFIGVQQVIAGTLRGAGNTLAAMMLAITTQWVFQFPLAYFLSQRTTLGVTGIWWAVAVANILAAFVAVIWFLRGDWKQRRLIDDIELQRQVEAEIAVDEGLPPT